MGSEMCIRDSHGIIFEILAILQHMQTISTLTWEVAVYSRNMRVEQGSVNTEQCEQPVSVKVWNCGTVEL